MSGIEIGSLTGVAPVADHGTRERQDRRPPRRPACPQVDTEDEQVEPEPLHEVDDLA
jgi:hypothetical protein